MFKKISLGIMLALVIVAGAATAVFAQAETPPETPAQREGMPRGERPGNRSEFVAEFLGMTVEELQAAHEEGKTIEDLLEEKGISQEDFQAAIQAAQIEALNQAVADGKLTQEQADSMLQRMEERAAEGFPPEFGGRPMDDERPNIDRPADGEGRFGIFTGLLGMSIDEITDALQDGSQTLKDLLDGKGISDEDVQSAMQEAHQQRLQQAVANGELTQEQADEMLTRMQERLESGEPGTHPGVRGGGGGFPPFDSPPANN